MALGDDAPRERRAPSKARNCVFLRWCPDCQHLTLEEPCIRCDKPVPRVVVRDEVFPESFRVYNQQTKTWET